MFIGYCSAPLALPARRAYPRGMFKAFEFCIPTRGIKVPSGADWLHQIKYNGYRLRVERDSVTSLAGACPPAKVPIGPGSRIVGPEMRAAGRAG